ncbi:hypothetical protein GDO86_015188 [Hymenochirus boettgeri]|uniref:Dolichyldiphosphatase 1 n=1 Tax=Hymenochirus boettgeri TaxID=247094 RepID=A0A8T2K025_9PIPI|nr:hypothetical protein GDO86_015188 [Hymenochirus boettgeri]
MELFEEALHKWEQALNLGQRGRSSTPSAPASETLNESFPELLTEASENRPFSGKLEALLNRAYNLQEDFGTGIPSSNMLMDLEGALMFPLGEARRPLLMDDQSSTTSEDSFFSAVELFETLQLNEVPFLPPKPAAAYEEALKLVNSGEVSCRTYRTELLGCYNDQDFLAKLHCIRQSFQVLLEDEGNQLFFGEVGKQMVSGLMLKAEKNPKGFLENYEQMLHFALKEDTWATTQRELKGRGVVCMNFFDIALDFILMDAFEDLESPPSSVIAVLRNRWLSDSFKETALATACWSVLKAKRRLLMVPDGFISHFYSVSEHVSPVLAFGFLGPKEHLTEICEFFKNQIVQYLKDMFDLDKVRYTSVQSLAEDILQLSRRRSDILLGYLGVETVSEMNGTVIVETGDSALDLGDVYGQLLAYLSLGPIFILISFLTLIIFKRELHTISFLLGLVINEGVNWLIKNIIREPRPCEGAHVTVTTEYGLPSSHSQFMWFFSAYSFLFLYLRMHQTNNARFLDLLWRHVLSLCLLTAACLVSYSRNRQRKLGTKLQ